MSTQHRARMHPPSKVSQWQGPHETEEGSHGTEFHLAKQQRPQRLDLALHAHLSSSIQELDRVRLVACGHMLDKSNAAPKPMQLLLVLL